MTILLNVVYCGLILLVSPWLVYAAVRHGKYRAGWAEKFLGNVPLRQGTRPCVWFHAVSVGEVNVLQSLLAQFDRECPDFDYVVSTTTATGYQVARQKYGSHRVCYCPLDFSWAVKRACDRIRPDLLVLVELEVWPNLIRVAHQRSIPVAIVNGRLSVASFRGYGKIRRLMQGVLRHVDWIGVQTNEYAERFRHLGAAPQCVEVTGSLKFDGAETDRSNPRTRDLARLIRRQPTDMLWIAGSTQDPEEAIVLTAFAQLRAAHPELRMVIVPRHPERFDDVARLLARSGFSWCRRSQLTEPLEQRVDIVLVDTMGELSAWWGMAEIAFVGGSLGDRGGQNMIEPAAYGAAVCFGPNTRNFRDVVERLLQRQAADVVTDCRSLGAFVERCLADPAWRAKRGQAARQLVLDHQGATDRTFQRLIGLIDSVQTTSSPRSISSRRSVA